MTQLNATGVAIYASTAGFPKAVIPVVVTIAYQESGWRTDAVGDQSLADPPGGKWGNSIGLMQIRSLQNPGAYSGADAMRIADKLTDPAYNMKVAKAIYDERGGKFTDWSTYNDRNKAGSGWAEANAKAQAIGEGSVLGTAGTSAVEGVSSATDSLKSLGALASTVQSGQFWTRVGIGAAGYALVLVGLLFLLVSSATVRDGAKTAGSAAIGLVPGGGTVKTIAKTATKAATQGAS